MKSVISVLLLIMSIKVVGQQESFPSDPSKARFITSDLPLFWSAFDSLDVVAHNPFINYINKGSNGVKGFTPDRIINADSLLQMVKRRKKDYEAKRDIESKIKEKEKKLIPYFHKLKELYPKTKFPPVYFVFGRFNSGGTSSKDGLIIGAEKLDDLQGLTGLIIHESIHFQQTFPTEETTLLQLSVIEGSADFISDLVTNSAINKERDLYANKHKSKLLQEFTERMNKPEMIDWLYSTSGKDDRPNDLGYWVGYKIVEAYYNKMNNKKLAIDEIINIKDYNSFLRRSGYLDAYLK